MATQQDISFQKLVSATVAANNHEDDSREYDITADVSIHEKVVNGFNAGQVISRENGQQVASFWGGDSDFSITFNSFPLADKRIAVFSAVCSFVESAKAKVAETPVMSI